MKHLMAIALLVSLSSAALADKQSDYLAGVAKWTQLKAQQSPACAEEVDSKEVLVGHKTDLSVLIMHGYTQNPQSMADYVNFFKRYDVNILVPRLAHHFDLDIKSLDHVDKQEWLDQTQKAYEAAEKLGSHVIVVGYSLGGLLASRLAVNPKNQASLAAAVLLSPALRLTGNVEMGAAVASMFKRSGNDWLKMAPAACHSDTPYLSVNGGKQVVSLMKSDRGYPGSEGTIYKNIFAPELDSSRPVFLGLVKNDEVVDSAKIQSMVEPFPSNGFTTILQFENNDKSDSPHSTLTKPGVDVRDILSSASHTPYGATRLFDQLSIFVKDWTGLTPTPGPINLVPQPTQTLSR